MRIVAAILVASVCFGQTEAGPSFEVASIKPSTPRTGSFGLYTWPGGRITGENRTVADLMEEAFHVLQFQIVGGANWVRQDRFDLEARPPASSNSGKSNPSNSKLPPNDEQRQMLQALLVERFHLRYHIEARELAVFLLMRARDDLKLRPAKDKGDFPWVGVFREDGNNGNGMAGINISMPLMAYRLSSEMQRPVLDRTGLEGSFDFKVLFGLEDPRPNRASSVLTGLHMVGLKLESSKASLNVFVIDSVEKPLPN